MPWKKNKKLRNAKLQFGRSKGFYVHSTIFVFVLLGLLGLNLWSGQPLF